MIRVLSFTFNGMQTLPYTVTAYMLIVHTNGSIRQWNQQEGKHLDILCALTARCRVLQKCYAWESTIQEGMKNMMFLADGSKVSLLIFAQIPSRKRKMISTSTVLIYNFRYFSHCFIKLPRQHCKYILPSQWPVQLCGLYLYYPHLYPHPISIIFHSFWK